MIPWLLAERITSDGQVGEVLIQRKCSECFGTAEKRATWTF